MSFINDNNVYLCNLDQDIIKHTKFFQYNIMPSDFSLSVNSNPTETRNNERVYNRNNEHITRPSNDYEPLTRATYFNNHVDKETILHNTVVKNNNPKVNSYIPNNNSDLYMLNVPSYKQKGRHELLFKTPIFSHSSTAPVQITQKPFLTSTRLERETTN